MVEEGVGLDEGGLQVAIAYVGGGFTAGGTQPVTLNYSSGAGNFLVLAVEGYGDDANTFTITDSAGQSWTPVTLRTSPWAARMYCMPSSAAITWVRLTTTGGGWYFRVHVLEFGGVAASDVVRSSTNNTGTNSAVPETGAMTVVPGDLAVGYFLTSNEGFAAASGWTAPAANMDGTVGGMIYQIAAGTSSNPNGTCYTGTWLALGGAFKSAIAATASDNFDRANETPLASPWGAQNGFVGGLRLYSNQATGVGSAQWDDYGSLWTANSFNDNQFSQITFRAQDGFNGVGIITRGSTTVKTCYYAGYNGVFFLNKWVNGTWTEIGTNNSTTLSTGDTFRLESAGTTHTIYKNGFEIAHWTDSSITSGRVGIYAGSSTNALDDWTGGDLYSYFGYNTAGSTSGAAGGYTLFNSALPWTCPGSGSQTVRELSAYCSGSGNARIAVYSADRSTLVASTDSFALSATPGWQGRTGANISPGPASLTGGANYVIAVTSNDQLTQYYDDGSAGDCAYILANYTGGFPASLGAGTGIARDYSIRCGVQAASGSTYSVSASLSAAPDMGESAARLLSVLSSLSSSAADSAASRGILMNASGLSSGASMAGGQLLRAVVASALSAATSLTGTGGSRFSLATSLTAAPNDLALGNRAILVSQMSLAHAVDMLASSRADMAAASAVAASAQMAFYGTIPGVGRFLSFVIDDEPVTFFV